MAEREREEVRGLKEGVIDGERGGERHRMTGDWWRDRECNKGGGR